MNTDSACNDQDLKDDLVTVMGGIIEKGREEARQDPLYEFVAGKIEWFKNADYCDTMIVFPFEKIMRECIRKIHATDDDLVGHACSVAIN